MMKKLTPDRSKSVELVSLLAAFSLFLATIEYLIPKPLPFIRIGLANLPILLSLELVAPQFTLLLVLLKVLGQGLVNGTMFSYIFIFSAAGSAAAGLSMLGIKQLGKNRISYIGISIVGALASNGIQLLLGGVLIFGEGTLYIAPPFLAIGFVSSIGLGIFANRFSKQSAWIKNHGSR